MRMPFAAWPDRLCLRVCQADLLPCLVGVCVCECACVCVCVYMLSHSHLQRHHHDDRQEHRTATGSQLATGFCIYFKCCKYLKRDYPQANRRPGLVLGPVVGLVLPATSPTPSLYLCLCLALCMACKSVVIS